MERLQGKHQNEGGAGRLKMKRRKESYWGKGRRRAKEREGGNGGAG